MARHTTERLTSNPATQPAEVIAAFLEGGKRTLFEVLFEQFPGLLIDLGASAGSLARRERSSLAELPYIALYRGEANTKGTAASLCPMPRRSTASTIFFLKSSE